MMDLQLQEGFTFLTKGDYDHDIEIRTEFKSERATIILSSVLA